MKKYEIRIFICGVASIALMAVFAPPISADGTGGATTPPRPQPLRPLPPRGRLVVGHPTTTTTVAPTPRRPSMRRANNHLDICRQRKRPGCEPVHAHQLQRDGREHLQLRALSSRSIPDAAGKVADVILGYQP